MLLTFVLALIAASAPPREPQTDARSRDLDFLLETIRTTHPDPYRANAREVWEREAAALRKTLASASDELFYVGLARLVALLEDGHSALVPAHATLGASSQPLCFRFFDDGLFVTAADPAHAALVGKRVVEIAGHPLDEVLAAMRPCLSADNEQGRRRWLAFALAFPGFLCGLDLAPASYATSIGVQDGTAVARVELARPEPGPPASVMPLPDDWPRARPAEPLLAERQPDKNYWFELLPEARAVYLRYARIQHDPGERFGAFCTRLFAALEEAQAECLIIDLRGNSGGNNYVNQPLVHGVIRSSVNRPGGVIVLIDGGTFSAAQNCATYLERETWALFAGAPTGARPNHFGDAVEAPLPESGHVLHCSTLRWQDSDPKDARPWIYPDLPIETTFADWSAGRDAVLEAALSWKVDSIEGYTGVLPRAHWQRATQGPVVWPPH